MVFEVVPPGRGRGCGFLGFAEVMRGFGGCGGGLVLCFLIVFKWKVP